jgi:hypothetical protein
VSTPQIIVRIAAAQIGIRIVGFKTVSREPDTQRQITN